jgi:effector-binding domain-containing protein
MAGPKIEARKASDLAYIEHAGPYDKVPWEEYLRRLYGWAKEQKGIYLSDPKTTSPEKMRCDIAITFKGKAKETGGIKLRKQPAMKVASISHKGPGSEYPKTYSKLMEFVEEKGYEVSGPPIEIYSKKPEVVNGVTILYAKVMMPVEKK